MINLYKILKISVKIKYVGIVFLLMPLRIVAQDIQFSQFFSNVLYLNPAFAGNAHSGRVILHQRIQWPSLDAKYITSVISLDNYFEKANSGVGIMVFKDWQGDNNISSTEVDLQYAYELHLSSKYSFRMGLQTSYVSRFLNYAYLTFPDQVNDWGKTGAATNQPFGSNKTQYLDFTAGGIFYSDNYWVGITYAHITEPNQTFLDGNSQLPSKYDFTAGYRIDIEKKRNNDKTGRDIYLTPTVHYKFQGKSDQTDVGLYCLYDKFITGVWYRGLPFLKRYRKGLANNESMVFQLGYRVNSISICYSYDVTVSKLAPTRTGGAHELNLTYLFSIPAKKKKKVKRIPCPHFYK